MRLFEVAKRQRILAEERVLHSNVRIRGNTYILCSPIRFCDYVERVHVEEERKTRAAVKIS